MLWWTFKARALIDGAESVLLHNNSKKALTYYFIKRSQRHLLSALGRTPTHLYSYIQCGALFYQVKYVQNRLIQGVFEVNQFLLIYICLLVVLLPSHWLHQALMLLLVLHWSSPDGEPLQKVDQSQAPWNKSLFPLFQMKVCFRSFILKSQLNSKISWIDGVKVRLRFRWFSKGQSLLQNFCFIDQKRVWK